MKKKNGLTIKKGCFTCVRHEQGCNVEYPDGRKHDVMEIHDNGKGEKYRCGCCCGDYKSKGFKFR